MWHNASAIFLFVIQVLILLYFIVLNSIYTLFTLISLKDVRLHTKTVTSDNLKRLLAGTFYKPLSIIVPAFNESKTIVPSLKSLLNLHYPEFEVVVVNDGSSDDTLEILKKEFRLIKVDKPVQLILEHNRIEGYYISIEHHNLAVIDKKNGGKADALNAGINASKFPLFCCIDADSLLENDAVLRATRLFVEDREVVATGGIVRVLNGCTVKDNTVTDVKAPRRMIECFQAVEYVRGFLSGRTAWNFFGSLLIISGAFGIFRKDMVMAIRGYRRDTVGEDMDLVIRLHKHCMENKIKYKIVFVPDPVCWTQVPSDIGSLLKQRNRWHRGLIDCLWHNRTMILNPKYGAVGMLGFPYFIMVEALGPMVEIIGYVGFIIFYFLGHINREMAFLFFILALLWGMWISLGSILLDNLIYRRYKAVGDIMKLCFYSFVEFFGYRQLIVIERLIATFQFRTKGWGRIRRQEISRD